MVWVEIFRIYSIQALSFLPCFFCLSVSHLCLPLSISFFVCVCMCLSEPFFIYLCPTLFDSTYLYFYFCLSPFLGLHYQISWIIKLCIGICVFITFVCHHLSPPTQMKTYLIIIPCLYHVCTACFLLLL